MRSLLPPRTPIRVLLVAALLLAGTVGPATAATDADPIRVALHPDGSATFTTTVSVDLTAEADAEAFDTLATDDEAAAAYLEEYVSRVAAVVNATERQTGREMTVEEPAISFATDGDVGTIILRLTWTNLAEVDDERLVVTEPFASGFETDRPVVVVPPEGYVVESAAPAPNESENDVASWDAGYPLDGYRLVLAHEGQNRPVPVERPGFDLLATLLVALGVALLIRSR